LRDQEDDDDEKKRNSKHGFNFCKLILRFVYLLSLRRGLVCVLSSYPSRARQMRSLFFTRETEVRRPSHGKERQIKHSPSSRSLEREMCLAHTRTTRAPALKRKQLFLWYVPLQLPLASSSCKRRPAADCAAQRGRKEGRFSGFRTIRSGSRLVLRATERSSIGGVCSTSV